ncbi:MAG TPA: TlpA disulfide reductase family protein [Thermoanaerobaculia bacterium]|nr:TlpA disulfide reductase family protein [Thermoanaerobaculia bacterium]
MPKLKAAFLDVLGGLAILAIAFGSVRLLLGSRVLVYLLFPALSASALAIGLWRGPARERRSQALSSWLTLALLNLPLAAALVFVTSTRDRPLFAFLTVTCVFSGLGVVQPRAPLALGGWLAANLALAVAVPHFVGALVAGQEVREPAPPFVLNALDGRPLTNSDLRGKVVVLDFWATWCVPCRRELPEIDRLAQSFAGSPDVLFFAVDSGLTDNLGDPGDTPEAARAFFAKQGYRLPLAWSGDGKLENAFNVHRFPSVIVLDRAGRIRLRHGGYVGAEDLAGNLSRLIDRLLREG